MDVKNSSERPQLAVHEWLAVIAFMAFISMIVGLSLWQQTHQGDSQDGQRHYLKSADIELFVQGAVANPGSYRVKTGTRLEELLKIVEPLPEADLRRLRGNGKLRHGQAIIVKTKPRITVFIEGAVKIPGEVSVPSGTTFKDLHAYLELTENADLNKFKSARRLRQGEKISIPEKKLSKAACVKSVPLLR